MREKMLILIITTVLMNNSYALQNNPDSISNRFISAACGYWHSLAVKDDGTVWSWGANWYGQIGKSDFTEKQTTPYKIEELNAIVSIACGDSHNLALKSDGTVWAWGSNIYTQLGNSTTDISLATI